MKLIIDIDDKVYGLLKYFEDGLGLDDKKDNTDDVKTALMRAVLNGTPLDDIKAELTEWHDMKHSSLSDANYQIMLDIIDKYKAEEPREDGEVKE